MKNQFLVLVMVSITTHIIRTIYEILKHKKIIRASRLSFIVVFVNMMLLWLSWFALCDLDANTFDLPVIIRYSGLFIVVAGIVLFAAGLLTIKALESYEGDLITHGLYSKIRHPMYTGFILWLIGMPVYCGGIFSSALAIVFIINVLFWRYLEERELEKRFPAYREYKRTTLF